MFLQDYTWRDPDDILTEFKTGELPSKSVFGKIGLGGKVKPAVSRATGLVAFDAYLANDRTLDDPEIVAVDPAMPVRLRLINACAASNMLLDFSGMDAVLLALDGRAISGEDTFTDGEASVTAEQTIGAIGLAQLKLGFANETAAIYALGGLALGQMETSAGLGGSGCFGEEPGDCVDLDIVNINDKQTVAGWTIGAGADAMVSENVSIGVTYNYVRFDYENSYDVNEQLLSFINILGEVNTDTSVSAHLMRASVSYHF